MNARAIAISTLVGTVTIFAWQTVSNALLPWHMATMHQVSDTTARAIPAIRQLAPTNGIYYSNYGVFLAVRIQPDNSDQATAAAMGSMLARQAALDLVIVLVLCLFVGLLTNRRPVAVARSIAVVGFAMIAVQELSNANWYGFSLSWALVNVVDQTISFALTGLVIGALLRRFDPDERISVELPEGQGYRRTSGGRLTTAR